MNFKLLEKFACVAEPGRFPAERNRFPVFQVFRVEVPHLTDNNKKYEASSAYFENRSCRYYPCHKSEHINCLFCFCPLYSLPDCPGNYELLETPNGTIKSCMDCVFPHKAENYGTIMELLKSNKYISRI